MNFYCNGYCIAAVETRVCDFCCHLRYSLEESCRRCQHHLLDLFAKSKRQTQLQHSIQIGLAIFRHFCETNAQQLNSLAQNSFCPQLCPLWIRFLTNVGTTLDQNIMISIRVILNQYQHHVENVTMKLLGKCWHPNSTRHQQHLFVKVRACVCIARIWCDILQVANILF